MINKSDGYSDIVSKLEREYEKLQRDQAKMGEMLARQEETILSLKNDNTRLRKTRAQETRNSEAHEPRQRHWGPRLRLDTSKIPPLPGMAQRWIRGTIRGEPDPGNIDQAWSDGWRPRPRESLPEGVYMQDAKGLGDYQFDGTAVSVYGMILMQRPLELHDQEAMAEQDMSAAQMLSVHDNVVNAHSPGDRGFTRIRMDHKSRVQRGISASVVDD